MVGFINILGLHIYSAQKRQEDLSQKYNSKDLSTKLYSFLHQREVQQNWDVCLMCIAVRSGNELLNIIPGIEYEALSSANGIVKSQGLSLVH